MKNLLKIENLEVLVENKKIINQLNFNLKHGDIHAIMGPNGSGKSTLAYTIMGHPNYKIASGNIFFDGENITNLSVDQRAKEGIFLAFQNPYEIEGLTLKNFLRQAYNSLYSGTSKELNFDQFEEYLKEKTVNLNINEEFLNRSLNLGFSGGEKKRAEILQLAVLQPKLVILDEIDSGLDVDALRMICTEIIKITKTNPEMSLIIITHYPRILHFLEPQFVHILQKGKIIESGDKTLAEKIEKSGYSNV